MTKIKNIIFDWSGTLSDDLTPVHAATNKVFKRLGLRALTLEEYKQEFVLPYMDFYKKFTDASKEKIDEFFLEEIFRVEKPKPFPKVKQLLEFLKKKKVKMIVLSAHPSKKLERELKEYGFQGFFHEVNGSVHDKIEAVKKIMERNGFKPDETAYVGDMDYDIEVGKKIGIVTIAVSWGYNSKERLTNKKPDFLVDKVREIKKLITKKNSKN